MSDFRPATGIAWNAGGQSGLVKYGEDNQLLVMFYNKAVENPIKSQEAGMRVCENQIFITIQHPGENLNKIDRPITDADKHRFRDQWSKFVQNRTQVPEGTPIDLLFPNYPAVGENLRAMGIFTIQQCAKLSANAIDNIGRGGQEYVNKAQRYLESADKGKNFHVQQKEITELKTRIRVLEQTNIELQKRMSLNMGKLDNPLGDMVNNPPFIPNYDAQSERINANHPTKEAAKIKAKKAKAKQNQEFGDPLIDELAGIKPQQIESHDKGISSTEDQDAVA